MKIQHLIACISFSHDLNRVHEPALRDGGRMAESGMVGHKEHVLVGQMCTNTALVMENSAYLRKAVNSTTKNATYPSISNTPIHLLAPMNTIMAKAATDAKVTASSKEVIIPASFPLT